MMKRPAPGPFVAWQSAIRRLLLVGAGFLLLALPALPAAAQKTDVVTLLNGDTITGEIKGIDKGLIRLSTSAMGTIDVRWAYVAAIDTDKTLEVELASGQRVYGSVQAAEEPRTVDVERVAGAMSVGLDDVAEAWPIGKSFWQKQDGSLDLGFSFTQASSQLQYNLNFSNTFSGRRFKIPVNISSSVTRVDGDTTTNRQIIDIAWMRDLRWEEWFGIVLGGVESNDELDLNFRASGGGGAGRYLGRSSRYDWAAYGAVIATQERYTSTSPDTSASLVAGTVLSMFVYGEHDLTFDTSFQAIPSITGSSRVRLDLQSSVNYEFVHNLYLGFNFYDQFDSNPPLATAQQNDFGVSSSVGYKW